MEVEFKQRNHQLDNLLCILHKSFFELLCIADLRAGTIQKVKDSWEDWKSQPIKACELIRPKLRVAEYKAWGNSEYMC